jgi:hypothetical protein
VNYAALKQAIQDYTQNYEQTFVDNIPVFVQQTEERIYNTVLIPALRKNVTGTATSGNKYLSCPTDFLSAFSMAVITGVTNNDLNTGSYEYLLNKDVNFIRQAYPTPNDTGVPQYYSLFGPTVNSGVVTTELSFILGPTPDANYNIELHYYYYPASIVTAGTSWIGDNYDPVLLYGSLLEAYIFMKGEQDIMAAYDKKYQDALLQLIRLGGALERGDAYRDGQYKGKAAP